MELEVSCLDLAEKASLVFIMERRVAAEENVDDNADAPHVHSLEGEAHRHRRTEATNTRQPEKDPDEMPGKYVSIRKTAERTQEKSATDQKPNRC